MKLLPLLLLSVSLSASGNIISQNQQKIQLYLIRLRIKLTTTTLHEKCPHLIEHDKFVEKRDIDTYDAFVKEQNYAIEMQVYNHVQALLKQCYDQVKSTRPRPTKLPTTTTPPTTNTPTTPTVTARVETGPINRDNIRQTTNTPKVNPIIITPKKKLNIPYIRVIKGLNKI